MFDSLAKFNEDLQQEIVLLASVEGEEGTLAGTFTEHMLNVLGDAGEVDGALVAQFDTRGSRASAFDVSEDEGTLHVFVTDYRPSESVQSLGKSELEQHFKRLSAFVGQASEGLWRRLEESAPAWDMAQRIDEVWPSVGELRFTVLTNAELRTELPDNREILGRPAHFSVWDIDRLHKLDSSGRSQEPITVDVNTIWGQALPCLGPHGEPGTYDAYLLILPGEFLARVYEQHGPRLLELNVRSFLQSRGKVNRAIQETIRDEPARFLAYNNGISMTASAVELESLPSGERAISRIHDLQIVNGGQTTASLHYAKVKNKADLSGLHVQAKLSVVMPDQLSSLVPRISQFANSQNRVNTADFTANDPFHVQVEKLSRTIWAPAKGGYRMTRWFYERARGQYADAHARERTPAKQRNFKRIHPVAQKFTKTDLAKFENTWDQLPWLVSLGAEKNFREFMLRLERRGRFIPNKEYFEALVSKAILFRSAERRVGGLHLGGYRAQTVTYTLAKLLNATAQRIDLGSIWKSQDISRPLVMAVEELAPMIHARLVSSAGTRNVSEWAKKEDCWKSVQSLAWDPAAALMSELIAGKERTRNTTSSSVGEILTSEEQASMDSVALVPADTWFEISAWAKQTGNLLAWQRGLAFSLGKNAASGKANSRKQAVQGVRILQEASRLGFAPSQASGS